MTLRTLDSYISCRPSQSKCCGIESGLEGKLMWATVLVTIVYDRAYGAGM